MCTVSVVPTPGGFRLACNRDEQRARAAAEPPKHRRAGALDALWPIDPESQGSWIGINEAGLAATLLNRTGPRHRPSAGAVSRGTIIPRLLQHDSLEHALGAALALAARRFQPFTLLLVGGARAAIVTSDGERLSATRGPLRSPLVLTSSSLGDHRVAPRRSLFSRMVAASRAPLDAQARFHRHRWPSHPDISVCMSRVDAATVSRTIVHAADASVTMRYVSLAVL